MHPTITLDIYDPQFWVAVGQIIIIDLLLSGDNAMVIAMACRQLPEKQRKLGVLWGVGGAVGLRVILTIFAVSLLSLPYLKLFGGLLLIWIGIKLVSEIKNEKSHNVDASTSFGVAIKTIILADLVMSLDNVVAVAAAARDSVFLLLFGLALSIPLMIWSSQIFLRLIDRFPFIVLLGGGLLGWIAVSMAITDPVLSQFWISSTDSRTFYLEWTPLLGFMVIIVWGLLSRRMQKID